MKGLSYVQKTVLPYLILLVFSLIGIGISASKYFDEFVMRNWEKELTSESNLIAEQLAPTFGEKTAESDLSAEAKKFGVITGNRVTIILTSGEVIGESDYFVDKMENHLLRPEIQAALRGENQSSVRLSTTLHQKYVYVAVPIYQEGRIVGVVRLAKSLAEFENILLKFRSLLLSVAAICLAFSLIFMLLQSNKRFNPLRKISEQIYTSSKGKLEVIEGIERKDEIGLVVAAHNTQVEKIKLQIQNMENEHTKLTAILFNMTDGVVLADADGKVTLINPAAQRIFSTNVETVEGDSLIEVVRQHQIVDLWKQTLSTGKTQSTTIQTSFDRDTIQVIASLLGPLLPGEVLLLFQDLSTIRKLENVRKDFVSNISHELRTPLTTLKVLTETLQNGAAKNPADAQRFLNQMDDEIDNMTQIVQELLELSKIESGRVPIEKKDYPVDEIIRKPIERMQLQAERSGISIIATMEDALPALYVDLPRIQQVFINIIHNSIKFTPPGGKITISAIKEDHQIIFHIVDTGVGISPKDLDRIFERFYKSDRSRSSGGTGLGLSISKHIIEAHGGKIWVESKQGLGSIFSFSIPLSEES